MSKKIAQILRKNEKKRSNFKNVRVWLAFLTQLPRCRIAANPSVLEGVVDALVEYLELRGEALMPIYEYVCDDCHKPFEKIVLHKSEKIECPKCGSKRHKMKFSVVNAAVKGGDGGSMTGFGGGMEGGGCCNPGGCGCG